MIAEGACPGEQLRLADLDGDGFKDYACVDPKTGRTTVQISVPDVNGKLINQWSLKKKPQQASLAEMARVSYSQSKLCISPLFATGTAFPDQLLNSLNGDGKDDYILVDNVTGDLSAWINNYKGGDTWEWLPLGKIGGVEDANNKTLQMVDLDGKEFYAVGRME